MKKTHNMSVLIDANNAADALIVSVYLQSNLIETEVSFDWQTTLNLLKSNDYSAFLIDRRNSTENITLSALEVRKIVSCPLVILASEKEHLSVIQDSRLEPIMCLIKPVPGMVLIKCLRQLV